MKKYIIPIILAIIIIISVVKLSNNGTLGKIDKQLSKIRGTLTSEAIKEKLDTDKIKLPEKVKEIKEEVIPKKEDIEEKPKEDRLMIDCKNSFKECRSIGIKKYGWSISLSETEKFYDKETAEEFYNTWSSLFNIGQKLELDYPIVLFAFSIKGGIYSIKLPDIAICEDGELTESSKMNLGC